MKKIVLSALILVSAIIAAYTAFYVYAVYFYEVDEETRAYIDEKDPHKKMSLLEAIMGEDDYSRWAWLDDAAELAYEIEDYEKAKNYALESLSLSSNHMTDWNYGNAIHNSNMVLGRISLTNGDISKAKEYLLESAESSGSPQLDTFGPSLELANELLQANEKDTVLSYLNSILNFWEMDNGCVRHFINQIENNEKPKLCNCSCR